MNRNEKALALITDILLSMDEDEEGEHVENLLHIWHVLHELDKSKVLRLMLNEKVKKWYQ